MRLLLVLVLLAGCAPVESGEVEVIACPSCPLAYDGFSSCAFFEADDPGPHVLVDAQQYAGAGIPVFHDGYMHHKFCFNSSHAAFGSANPTDTGLGLNDNLVVRVESATMAGNFRAEYDLLSGRGDGGHVDSWTLNGRRVDQFFCPRDACEEQLLGLLSGARERVLFLTFSFTSDALGQRMVELSERGVCVSGVMESLGVNGVGSEAARFERAGIPVAVRGGAGVMHLKVFLVDDVAVVGSYNPSASANLYNAETLVFMREPALVREVERAFARLGGAACPDAQGI